MSTDELETLKIDLTLLVSYYHEALCIADECLHHGSAGCFSSAQ